MTNDHFTLLHQRQQEFTIQQIIDQSTALVSLRKEVKDLNGLSPDCCCNFQESDHHTVDREHNQVPQNQEGFKTFKRKTNLPEIVTCISGPQVMYLNNTHISQGISNGSCGLIVSVTKNSMPKITFPIERGLEVCIKFVDISVMLLLINFFQQLQPLSITDYFTINGILYS